MFDNKNMPNHLNSSNSQTHSRANSPREFGVIYRAERKAQGKTLQEIAELVGCRRQTIADIEAGKSVGMLTVFMALAALGKCVEVKSTRYEFGSIPDLMENDV
jgi:transcriptional regulator with XRE-family HTH domain